LQTPKSDKTGKSLVQTFFTQWTYLSLPDGLIQINSGTVDTAKL